MSLRTSATMNGEEETKIGPQIFMDERLKLAEDSLRINQNTR
jgi:hypothetical protein